MEHSINGKLQMTNGKLQMANDFAVKGKGGGYV